jgi:hypothetical protein
VSSIIGVPADIATAYFQNTSQKHYHLSQRAWSLCGATCVQLFSFVNNKIYFSKAEGKMPLGRSGCRQEYIIKMNIEETGWGRVDWIRLAQDRDQCLVHVKTVISIQIPQRAGNFLSKWEVISFSRRNQLCEVRYPIQHLYCWLALLTEQLYLQ